MRRVKLSCTHFLLLFSNLQNLFAYRAKPTDLKFQLNIYQTITESSSNGCLKWNSPTLGGSWLHDHSAHFPILQCCRIVFTSIALRPATMLSLNLISKTFTSEFCSLTILINRKPGWWYLSDTCPARFSRLTKITLIMSDFS